MIWRFLIWGAADVTEYSKRTLPVRFSLDFCYRKIVWSCGKGGNHESQRARVGSGLTGRFKAGRECVRAGRVQLDGHTWGRFGPAKDRAGGPRAQGSRGPFRAREREAGPAVPRNPRRRP